MLTRGFGSEYYTYDKVTTVKSWNVSTVRIQTKLLTHPYMYAVSQTEHHSEERANKKC
jgi:hypothetical protein